MADLAEKFKNLEVSGSLFKDVKFYVSGEIPEEVITLLTKGGADQSKYFSDFVTHLICGENPEETDIIDATDVYEVPAVTSKWILISSQLNKLVSTTPFLFNRPQIFASKIFCFSRVKDDLESLWALITYHGGKVQLNLDQKCDYLITVDINSCKYEKALSLGPDKVTIVSPDWILECVKSKGLVQPDLFHPRLIDWPKPPPPVHHESTTTITGFEESEATDKDNPDDEVANSTQALLEKLKQRMPWNQPEQPATPQQKPPKNEQNLHPQASPKMKEIAPPNVVAPSFQQKQGEHSQSPQMLSHQQILQKLQMSQQAQGAKSSMSNIPQQMTPEQQQMVQNALQQAQQNIHSQRMNQQNIQQQSQMQSTPLGFSQQNVQSQQSSQSNIVQQQQPPPIQSPSPLQQSPVAQQGPRAVLHHLPQGQQLQFQQNAGINRNINRPSLQQLRGQLGTTQLQQQLLQQQQQRLNQQQQQQQQQNPQNILQRTQLTLQQQQLLQLQLQQGQISQARQLLQQNQQQINLNQNQAGQPTPMSQNQQILSGNQMINTQHLTPSQLSQLQNRAQQLNQQKLAQNHQISQLLAQRQAQLNQRLSQQISSEQLLQNQQIGQPQLATQPMAQNQQMQLNQNRLVSQNQQHLQQMKLAQQQQNQQTIQTSIVQNQQLGQNLIDHGQIGQQVDQQMGQIQQQNQMGQIGNNPQLNQAMAQNQQINQGMVQNQQINQSMGQNPLNLNSNQLSQNQIGQGLGQGLAQSQLSQSQQQISQGLNQQQLNQGLSQSHQMVQGGLNQSQQLLQSLGQNQQLNQNLNESLGQSQQMTQTQRLLQSQQLNPQITQTQPEQNQQQQLTDSPRQQINLGLNHILNQQINQGNMVAQQRLNQNQLINQQLNQLNQQLSQNQQIGHQQIPQSPIVQSPNQQFGNMIQQQLQNQQQQLQGQQILGGNQQQQLQGQQILSGNQQQQLQGQQILGGNQLTQVRQVVGSNQQIIQQSQFAQNQPQFGQVQQQPDGQGQVQQQLLNQQQNQFAQQQVQNQQQGIQPSQTVRPHLQQALWAQQQAQQAPGQIQRQPLNVQQQQGQGQRVQWPPGAQQGQGVQPRQFIHLDAQTHNQLQKMPPEQQALFIARLQQKQRQLMLKQAQQRGSGHIVIRGPVPAGLNPQQQMAWLQQQANKQGVVLPTNLQQQTVSSTTMSQQPGPQATPGPSGLNQTPGLSPIQQTSQAQQEHNLKLKQLRLQQLQASGQVPKGAATPSLQQQQQQQQQVGPPQQQPGMARPMVAQPPIAEPPVPIQDPAVGQSQVLVNPKTKTALANMLSIRLQSGGNTVGATQDALPEPSAAGTLRLMTAQHNASLNANNRPLDLLAMQQQQQQRSRALQGGPNGDTRPSAPQQPLPAIQQAEQQQQQVPSSPKSTVPLQHRPGPFYGHNPNLKLPENKFFLGCVFVVAEVEQVLRKLMPDFKKKVEGYGGEVVKEYCARVTHILCETQRHGIVMQALRDCKRCVTLYWLEDVMRRRQLLPPWIALHVPAIYIDTSPCSKHLVSSAGFKGQEKGRVHQMINSTGAKYTEYFSKHNTLLVAAKMDGDKCKRAKAWGIPIVNVQWLTDVMLGNYVALQQLESVVYQQFSEPTNFCFDPKLCPNIMHGWKMPINISQEAYEKVKKATPAESGPSKKPRQAETDEDSEDDDDDDDDEEDWTSEEEDSEYEVLEEEDAMVVEGDPNQDAQYAIMFSSFPSSNAEDFADIVRQLGGSPTNKWNKCTHLVLEKLERTIKLVLSVPRHIPIVPLKWLKDSKAAGKFLDTSTYIFEEDEVEGFNRQFSCDFNALLRMENRDKLFQGRTFWITPRVFPNEHMVRRVIETSGGVVEEVRRTAAQIEATNQSAPQSYFIVTIEEDIHLTGDLLRNKKDKTKYICNTELVFHAVMKQEIEVEPWAIRVV